MFKLVVWGGFFLAMSLTGWGLWRMNIGEWQKGYVVVSWLFLISSTFTLAKMIRDRYEADLMARTSESEAVLETRPV